MTFTRCPSTCALLALAALAPLTRGQDRVFIDDAAGLFSPAAIETASQQIAAMERTFHRELVLDTVSELDLHDHRGLKYLWKWQVEKQVRQQARERAEHKGVDGVYVLISLQPRDVQAIAWPAQEQSVFDSMDCEQLRRLLVHRLQQAGSDQALRDKVLLAAVHQVRDALRENKADKLPPRTADNLVLALVLGAGGVLIAFWLVLRMVRRPAHEAEPRELTPAILGSLFGSPAGFWIYDKLFLAYRPPAPVQPASPPPAALLEPTLTPEEEPSAPAEPVP